MDQLKLFTSWWHYYKWRKNCCEIKKVNLGTSLVVQWLKTLPFNAGGVGSIPDGETKFPCVVGWGQKLKKDKERKKTKPHLRWNQEAPWKGKALTYHSCSRHKLEEEKDENHVGKGNTNNRGIPPPALRKKQNPPLPAAMFLPPCTTNEKLPQPWILVLLPWTFVHGTNVNNLISFQYLIKASLSPLFPRFACES